VIVRKTMLFGGQERELKTYQPAGPLSREDRLRAERLDEILSARVPVLAEAALYGAKDEGLVRRWYLLGSKLREVVDDTDLVLRSDVENGLVWQAIWQYLPRALRPKGSQDEGEYGAMQHKRKDHLSLCYEISRFPWAEVEWIERWDDWHQISFRPGVLRDRRVLHSLGVSISRLPHYPSRQSFRAIAKKLGGAFPTRDFRDSTVLAYPEIVAKVSEIVAQHGD